MTRILGVDPGLTHTGYGLIEYQSGQLRFVAAGTISPKPKEELAYRLAFLAQELSAIITQHQPQTAAIEQTFVSMNGASTLKLGQARGALLLTLAQHKLAISEYAPNLVKKSLSGSGHADKTQMMSMINMLLPTAAIRTPDAADALAIAICHAHHM